MLSFRYILTIACPDRVGIVAAVSGVLAAHRGNIVESNQFSDTESGRFFMRLVFDLDEADESVLLADFTPLAQAFEMDWRLYDRRRRPRVMILVSKAEHCLNDLLYRHRTGALPMEITAIVSNHQELAHLAEWHTIPYHHLPVTPETKPEQERQILELIEQTRTELVVLARYMQILSPELCRALAGRAINIHHSFLPGFKGAKPYHQAYDRGVKLIGATAHFVTANLDEGPIIEQEVERVDHAHSPEQLAAVGRDIENIVLARAILYHLERRVFLNGKKTVVLR
ncbi:MAG TPA: formyltetrahydrofolate deformylase [Candidatus Competibacteraceae bacterium]|nr:MAG: formyltetrahydrofolate deformylase [Candidatus Competibacteraceae bacterium]HOB62637.1 formyltetrahydrofolate deformylase [Candidatus Competibacteraceae bacterium]HQA26566.1 formyltetrahydrofolate deformylase [Candidatus Competibacteraceae bacterium]HQD56953.1 formyltetrahydrofolate deformylase [Candidatus Competibacteraceae bacterium]